VKTRDQSINGDEVKDLVWEKRVKFREERLHISVVITATLFAEPGLLTRPFDGRTDLVARLLPLPAVGFV
jgi:hypothetical protein